MPPQANPTAVRDRIAAVFAVVTIVWLGAALLFARDARFLMPGPLSSAHGAIAACTSCHAKTGTGAVGWLRGLVAGDPIADSKACITCHDIPNPAFAAHSAPADVLEASTRRLLDVAARTPAPISAHIQSLAVPTEPILENDIACATCHQEHKGADFKLDRLSNEQCRSCHALKFDSFDGNHPKFDAYPFTRRTRLIFDHTSHFGKHYPEIAKKDPKKSVPATCATCHSTRQDKRIMGVLPFEQTCATCHLDQITGKDRISGPKGVAFLSVPGLDLTTLKKKKIAIGEWPDGSEAQLTPFMKVMISRTERGRQLVRSVESFNLLELSAMNDEQLKAVGELAWEIKRLIHDLIKGRASDVLGALAVDGDERGRGGSWIADLTASIPRDVVLAAQRQWLPNLANEMASRARPDEREPGAWNTTVVDQTGQSSTVDLARTTPGQAEPEPVPETPDVPKTGADTPPADRPEAEPAAATPGPEAPDAKREAAARTSLPNPQTCLVSVFGQCLVTTGSGGDEAPPPRAGNTGKELPQPLRPRPSTPSGTTFSQDQFPPSMRAGLKEAIPAEDGRGASGSALPPAIDAGAGKPAPPPLQLAQAPSKPVDQKDDLLFPTEEELRAMKGARNKRPDRGPARPSVGAPQPPSAVKSEARPATAASLPTGIRQTGVNTGVTVPLETTIEPENWAEHGGWYPQDYTVSYRPAGHKDWFITAWLRLTGPKAHRGEQSPLAAVFDLLTSKDGQGSCAKCHSVDDVAPKGRQINFSPAQADSKKGRFTTFIHEPHLGTMDSRGCLTCHTLERDRSYQKTFEQGNPLVAASNFKNVEKELCQTCHTTGKARQDCLTCHVYHLNGANSPKMLTRIPVE